ncbi:MAG: hypothetical protein N2235_00195 [Fischerella sp.]|nr:hypothetical protein [Fischerella sp.]
MNWIRECLLPKMEYFCYFTIFLPGILISTGALTSYSLLTTEEFLQPHKQLIEKSLKVGAIASSIGLIGLTGSAFLAAMYDQAVGNSQLEFEEQQSYKIKSSSPYSKHSKCRNCKFYSGKYLLPCAVHPELKVDCPDWEPRS